MFDTSAPAHITENDRDANGASEADATSGPYPAPFPLLSTNREGSGN